MRVAPSMALRMLTEKLRALGHSDHRPGNFRGVASLRECLYLERGSVTIFRVPQAEPRFQLDCQYTIL